MNASVNVSVSRLILLELRNMPFPNTESLESISSTLASSQTINSRTSSSKLLLPYLYLKYRVYTTMATSSMSGGGTSGSSSSTSSTTGILQNSRVAALGWQHSVRARTNYPRIPSNKIDFVWWSPDNANAEVHLGYLSTEVRLVP